MYLTVIEQKEMETAREKLDKKLFSGTDLTHSISFQDGKFETKISYHETLDIWVAYRYLAKEHLDGKDTSQHWYAYGIGNPAKCKILSVVCEINIAVDDYVSVLGGGIARNTHGNTYLFHSGKIAEEGAWLKKLWHYYTYKLHYGEKIKEVARIGKIASPSFMHQLATFIRAVEEIKSLNNTELKKLTKGSKKASLYSRV